MANPIRKLLPSMFHRRLLLLAIGGAIVALVLSLQMLYLTTGKQTQFFRKKLNARLVNRSFLPTIRGRIVDRHGRVLAEDRSAYDVAMHYRLLSGRWAYRMAVRAAWRMDKTRWVELDQHQREQLIGQHLVGYENQVNQVWNILSKLTKITRLELMDRRNSVVRKVQHLKSYLWARRYAKRLVKSANPTTLADQAGPVAEEYEHHTVIDNIELQTRLAIQQYIDQADRNSPWHWVRLADSKTRVYPYETIDVMIDRSTFPPPLASTEPLKIKVAGLGLALIGTTRRMWAQDSYLKDKPFVLHRKNKDIAFDLSGYREGDVVGAWGIEKWKEKVLRGSRGQQVIEHQTGELSRTDPISGKTITLSIDIGLQARIDAIMNNEPAQSPGLMLQQPWHAKTPPHPLGTPLNGAAIVMHIPTGEILAATTVPSFSLDDLKHRDTSYWRSAKNKLRQPRMFRPIAMPYAPGSTIKPIVLVNAITDGKITSQETIDCKGPLDLSHPTRNRCWIYKLAMIGHGPLAGEQAIMRSCNVFFYTLGRRYGLKALASRYRLFGLGQKTGVGLANEHAGWLVDLSKKNRRHWSNADAIQMGIGQGPVEWTPLQAANAYAILVRQGKVVTPTFEKRVGITPIARQFKISSQAVKVALAGMRDVVSKYAGTANHLNLIKGKPKIFNLPNINLWGKSGTASTPKTSNPAAAGDHAWVICLASPKNKKRPQYVIVVVVEHAGSGGNVSGPIANQILHAMHIEGYL